MQLRSIFIFFCIVILGLGCDYVEVPTPANVPGGGSSGGNGRHKKVLVEEVTGHHCVTCPAGTIALNNTMDIYGDSMILIAIHAGYFAEPSPPFTLPNNAPAGSFSENFNTPEGNDFDLTYNISGSPPMTLVNRLAFPSGPYAIQPTSVATVLDTALDRAQSVDFQITHTYDNDTRALSFSINGNFLTPQNNAAHNYNVVAVITEDGLTGYQQNNAVAAGWVANYTFNHVLRACVNTPGSIGGSLVHTGVVNPGDTIDYTLPAAYTVSNAYNAANCHLIVYIYNTITKEVLQAEEVELED